MGYGKRLREFERQQQINEERLFGEADIHRRQSESIAANQMQMMMFHQQIMMNQQMQCQAMMNSANCRPGAGL